MNDRISRLFDIALDRKASDIHLVSGQTPRLRISGKLVEADDQTISADEMLNWTDSQHPSKRVSAGETIETSILHREVLFNLTAFQTADGETVATLRLLANYIPPLEAIAAEALPLFKEIAASPRGLVLITGPTGSGKTTVLCSIVDEINATREDRIFVVSPEPVYRFTNKSSLVTQIRVKGDGESMVRALELSHMCDLDCVALTDITTLEVLRQVLFHAETGHLVLANLHADSPIDAIERILNISPLDSAALRQSLANNLLAVTTQRLTYIPELNKRVPSYWTLKFTSEAKEHLRRGNLEELERLVEPTSGNPEK